MDRDSLIQQGISEISHLNDRRFIVALAGIGGIIYLGTRPAGNCELAMFSMACVGILALGTVATLTIRPERLTAKDVQASEAASASIEVKQ